MSVLNHKLVLFTCDTVPYSSSNKKKHLFDFDEINIIFEIMRACERTRSQWTVFKFIGVIPTQNENEFLWWSLRPSRSNNKKTMICRLTDQPNAADYIHTFTRTSTNTYTQIKIAIIREIIGKQNGKHNINKHKFRNQICTIYDWFNGYVVRNLLLIPHANCMTNREIIAMPSANNWYLLLCVCVCASLSGGRAIKAPKSTVRCSRRLPPST